ncbi:MAG: hypothetical protein HDS38_07355 [Bacteroides sp.]|nr:hypothetical protein [Bacteroides sp.]
MDNLIGLVLILGFYIEVYLIYKIEKNNWGTIYTPINLLMLPYAFLIPIAIISFSVNDGYCFYYPSLLIWMIGLLVFEIPSVILSAFIIKKNTISYDKINLSSSLYSKYLRLNIVLVGLFFFRFLQLYKSGIPVGSDEFGEAFATYGLWGHLNLILMIFNIGNIILLGSRQKSDNYLLILLIIAGSAISFLNQVKGWMLIPLIGGIIVRLRSGQLKLSPKIVLFICTLGSLFFFLSYYIALVVLGNNSDTSWFWEFIRDHFIFYLTSGVNGLAEYCRLYMFSSADLVNAVSNICYPINMVVERLLNIKTTSVTSYAYSYLDIAYGESNVRTFFGDYYILGGISGGIILVLFNSLICYSILLFTKINKSLFLYIAYGFVSGILTMGWFSSYTQLLNTYEVPIFCFVLYLIQKKYKKYRLWLE